MGCAFKLFNFSSHKKAASELRNQAGDMFRCKKVKGERSFTFIILMTVA